MLCIFWNGKFSTYNVADIPYVKLPIFKNSFQGLTKSLIESPPTAAGIQTTEREMATSVGYVLGFLFGGFLLARFSRNFIMLLTLQVLGSMLVTVPWIDSDWATDTVYIIIGVCIAILMIGKPN